MPRVSSLTTESEEILLEHFTVVNNLHNLSSYNKLEAVINHLYDSLFVYFNEGTKKDVLQILWSTLPNDVSADMHNRNDKWSRTCILEAYRKVANHDCNIINAAINNLKNCRNVPYIAEEVTDFIRKYNDRTLGNDFQPNKRKCDYNRKRGKSIDIDENELEQSGFFLGTCYTPIIAVLAVILIVSVFLYFLDKVNTKLDAVSQEKERPDTYENKQANTKTTEVTYWNTGVSENQPALNIIQMSSPIISTIIVKSYMEYKTVISDILAGLDLNLTLAIQSTQHWPDNATLNITDNIVDLQITGAVNPYTIFNILSSMPNIRSLKITNSFNHLCRSGQNDRSFNGKIIQLQSLKEVHFDNFPECIIFYKQFVKHTAIRNLSLFRLSRSHVTENNYVLIQKLLRKSRDSIESLQFPETTWNAPLFDYRISTLHNLHSIHIDFLNNSSGPNSFSISRYIDNFFPNLKSFTSSYGYLPISEFQHLSDCKKLTELKIKLVIPENQTSIELSSMTTFFPQIQHAELYFRFESWLSRKVCRMDGVKQFKAHVNNLLLQSNCPLVN